jgi:hypothetical protein
MPIVQSILSKISKRPDLFPEETSQSIFLRVQGGLWGCLSNYATNAIHEIISKKNQKQETELNSHQTDINVSSIVDTNSSAEDEESLIPVNNNNNNEL